MPTATIPRDATRPFDPELEAQALATRESGLLTPTVITEEQMDLVKKTIAPDLSEPELQLFFFECKRRGVHPLDRLIHPTKRKGRLVMITSIDYMRSRAAQTGDHAGTEEPEYESGGRDYPELARVHVYRFVRGEKCRFTGVARWREFYPGDGNEGFMWRAMPHGQLGKCAEAQALRKGFPQELDKLYIAEELDQAIGDEAKTAPKREPIRRSDKERRARDAAEQSASPPPQPPRGEPKAAGSGSTSAAAHTNESKSQHFLNVRIMDARWMTPRDEDPFGEIALDVMDGSKVSASHVLLTRDPALFKLAKSVERTQAFFKVTFHLGKRRDGQSVKILEQLEAMD